LTVPAGEDNRSGFLSPDPYLFHLDQRAQRRLVLPVNYMSPALDRLKIGLRSRLSARLPSPALIFSARPPAVDRRFAQSRLRARRQPPRNWLRLERIYVQGVVLHWVYAAYAVYVLYGLFGLSGLSALASMGAYLCVSGKAATIKPPQRGRRDISLFFAYFLFSGKESKEARSWG
jgi:hypothetical protein